MVPLPMTAAEKFHEAAYFYNQMIATVNDTHIYRQHLCSETGMISSATLLTDSNAVRNDVIERDDFVRQSRNTDNLRNDGPRPDINTSMKTFIQFVNEAVRPFKP